MAIRPENGQLLGTYPCTRKFFYQSGLWLDELAWESGGEPVSNYPRSRPEQGKVNETDYLLDDNKEVVKIPVEKAVVDNMLLELEKLGLDRSFANLIIRNAGGDDFYGGVVYISRDTLDRNGDINLFRNSDALTEEFFENNKDGVMFTLVHEIFHVLAAKITLLNPIDRFKVISKIKRLNLSLNPVFKREELCGDSMNTNDTKNIYEENRIRIKNLSETNRTKYLIQHLMGDVNNSVWPELSQIGIYSKYFDRDLVNFVNVRAPSDFDLSKRFASAKYSEKYFSLAIQKYYEKEQSTMTHLDKFVFEELISRVNTTGLYSESIIWYQNEDTSTYYSSTLPLLLIYTSMARGDNRFMNAIKEDLVYSVKQGRITELESKYKFRKILRLSKQIAERNQASETNVSSPEEFLADQFSFAMIGNLKPDINNFFSGLKSQRLIEDSKDEFVQLIEFYKDRNLAQFNTNNTV